MVYAMSVFDYLKIKNQYVLLKYRLSIRSAIGNQYTRSQLQKTRSGHLR